MTREEQKKEALVRLKKLTETYLLPEQILKDFEERGQVYASVDTGKGIPQITSCSSNKDYMKVITEFESTGALVYHLIDTRFRGDLKVKEDDTAITFYFERSDTGAISQRIISLLYVTAREEHWGQETLNLRTGTIAACCLNEEDRFCSESGEYGDIVLGASGARNGVLIRKF